MHTVFTWLNVVATICHVINFDAATIQGWPLIDGDIYCIEAPSVRLLFNIVKLTMHVSYIFLKYNGC